MSHTTKARLICWGVITPIVLVLLPLLIVAAGLLVVACTFWEGLDSEIRYAKWADAYDKDPASAGKWSL